jgi:hypothetical protein
LVGTQKTVFCVEQRFAQQGGPQRGPFGAGFAAPCQNGVGGGYSEARSPHFAHDDLLKYQENFTNLLNSKK